jgi:hypothetical protein
VGHTVWGDQDVGEVLYPLQDGFCQRVRLKEESTDASLHQLLGISHFEHCKYLDN